MKKSAMLAGIAAMMGAACGIPDPFETIGGIPRPEPKIAKENRKKCKSCKYLGKNENGRYACKIGPYGNKPNDVACEHHERRKK